MCEAIVEAARRRAQGRPVRRLRVQVGEDLAADADAMQMAFTLVGEGTELEDAELELVPVRGSTLVLESLEYRTPTNSEP
jgi:hydrogenase nickel incorporation protein HypA/HybF